MKEVNRYILFVGLGLVAIYFVINYLFVKNANDDKVNDSLAKARKAKEQKRQNAKKEADAIDREANEIINSLQVIENKN
jgi:F0F1-type ATP synthase membrane subunit b/b'